MSNKKLFGKINFFDIIIIVLVAIVAIVALTFYYSREKKAVDKGTKMTYTLELVDSPLGFSKLIHEGDNIKDSTKNFNMGTVIKVEKTPNTKILSDLQNSRMVESETPDKERVVLTVEANVVDTGVDLLVDNQYDIRVGKDIYVKGPRYGGVGYILSVERKQEDIK